MNQKKWEERQLKKKIVLCYFGKLYHPLIVQFPKILHQNKICWKYLCVVGGCARTKLLAGGQESSIRSWWTFFGKHTYLLLLILPQWAKRSGGKFTFFWPNNTFNMNWTKKLSLFGGNWKSLIFKISRNQWLHP